MGSGSVSPPISFASSIDLGGRTIQQDAYIMLPNLFSVSNKVYHVFGIFDGHGSDGHKASEQAKKSLEKETLSRKELIATNPHQAILEIFVAINQDLSNEQSWDSYLSGTTAVVAIIVDNQVHFGSVGDSRLVIISEMGGELVYKQLTRQSLFSYRDHTAAVESERQRLEAKGARLEQLWINGKFDGPLRIFKGSLPYPGY
jgi:serine/threonine protein phosphatase PrpC